MTEPVTSSPSQTVPPVRQTTAASPDVSSGAAEVRAVREELVQSVTERPPDPRPRTLATQEIRLALSFTGGVSLAVWMGGIARELNLLVQASERRRTLSDEPDETTPDPNRLRRSYRRLLDLVDAEVAIDVLAGTSAGGINAALLGLANARGIDLEPLRRIWLTAGDFGKLMRDPAEQAPPSLLKGDGQMLSALDQGIGELIATPPQTKGGLQTDVFITTTFLSPETSRFTDDYGTEIADTDHHGMFHFTTADLAKDEAVAQLALAARSSASFPGAFEPSFLPFGEVATGDAAHPDMRPFTNATRPHWAADGGLLANRPIAPLLQRIFDRPADREVRRALLYVVPSTGSPAAADDVQAKPLGLAAALTRDLGAAMNQSIAADLAAIKEHNDRVRSAADTSLRMVSVGNRLGPGLRLSDEAAWQDYKARQGDWLVAPLVAELCRQLTTLERRLPDAWKAVTGTEREITLRAVARDTVTKDWPPPAADGAVATAVLLGRPAFDSAKATLLRLLRLGRVLATTMADRNSLADLGKYATRPLSDAGRGTVRSMVEEQLDAALKTGSEPGGTCPDLATVVTGLAVAYKNAQVQPKQLRSAWNSLARTYLGASGLLRELVAQCPAPMPDEPRRRDRVPVRQRRAVAAGELAQYLGFFGEGEQEDVVARFLDLHVAVRSVLPVLTEVPQPVELIQVSADTRALHVPHHSRASTKLTGMQVHHFGAFYKPSWRANDWMWGRLDGCGWLVHVLLDPRRILSVMENDGIEPGRRAATFAHLLGVAVDAEVPPARIKDLEFLDDEAARLPVSLPELATWVASALQRHIAAEELPVVVGLVQDGEQEGSSERRPDGGYQGRATTEAVSWLAGTAGVDWATATWDDLASVLDACPVPAETIAQEAKNGSPLFIRTATQATAVATAAATGIGETPTSLKPAFATARTVTRTAYVAADRSQGRRRIMTLVGLGLLAGGVLALLTAIPFFGLSGFVAFAAGAVVLAFAVGPRTKDALRIVLALALVLLAAAPWLPWLKDRLFPWLTHAVAQVEKTPWIWPVLLFLVILPPASAVGHLWKSRRSAPAASGGRVPSRPPRDDGAQGGVVPTPREASQAGAPTSATTRGTPTAP